eukprot:2980417-Pyramimonas_sp.AAC.1
MVEFLWASGGLRGARTPLGGAQGIQSKWPGPALPLFCSPGLFPSGFSSRGGPISTASLRA